MFTAGDYEEEELTFREQADGRKVCWLPNGKIALVCYEDLERVQGGETWRVRLQQRDTYAIAFAVSRVAAAPAVPSPVVARPRQNVIRPETTVADTLPFQKAPVPVEAPAVRVETKEVTPPSDLIRETDRVAFFVDAANVDLACRDAGYFIDFARALRFFRGAGVMYGAYYYVADFTVERDSKQVTFLDYLNYNGYVVRLKKVKRMVDRETGVERFKANVDTELVVDMLNTSDNYDVALLFSGDSDYERLVDILRSRGKRVYVVSSRETLSRELSYVADKPVYLLEDLRTELARDV